MSPVAVRVSHLSKRYRIGAAQARYKTLRETLMQRLNPRAWSRREPGHIWALDDVSFEIEQGEVVGVIGRNGAGKSTLLKLLAHITNPTKGRVEIHGRVGSLLEVGTGFHPELTGRDNIYLNGAILGMKRAEIDRKFDEIVDFAEIEKFLDTPAKHYSSGMYMRLAFAVAAHLNTEILLVDEVLAVGDSEFQKKCLGKMEEISSTEGRTVFFVSHNLEAVLRLCDHALLLEKGNIIDSGSTEKVLKKYLLSSFGSMAIRKWDDTSLSPGDNIVRLIEVNVLNKNGDISDFIDISEPVTISIDYEVLEPGHIVVPGVNFYNELGVNIFDSHDNSPIWKGKPKPKGRYKSRLTIPGNFFSEGLIIIGAAAITPDPFLIHFHEKEVVAFNIKEEMNVNNSRGYYAGNFPGIIRPLFNWETEDL